MPGASALGKRTPATRPDDTRYTRTLVPGSRLVRSRVGASVMGTAPTFTASSAATLAKTIGPYDARFRISGAQQFINGNAGSGYPQSAQKSDGSYSVFAGSWRRSFDFDGQAFEFRTTPQTDSRFRVWVNEQPHAAAPVQLTTVTGTTIGSGTWLKVDFGSRAQRRVMLEMLGNNPVNFNNLNVATVDSVTPPSIPTARIAWVGDSIAYGIGASSLHLAYPIETAWLLGIDDVYTSTAVPSTGLIQTNAPYGAYAGRLASDVTAIAPDIVVIQTSINDTTGWPAFQGQVGPALTSYVRTLRAALPKVLLAVVSPIAVYTPTSSMLALRDEVKAAATALGVPFIDALSLPVFFGSGRIGATTGDGNADFYCENSAVKTHPSDAGADYLARWMAGQLGPIIGQPL